MHRVEKLSFFIQEAPEVHPLFSHGVHVFDGYQVAHHTHPLTHLVPSVLMPGCCPCSWFAACQNKTDGNRKSQQFHFIVGIFENIILQGQIETVRSSVFEDSRNRLSFGLPCQHEMGFPHQLLFCFPAVAECAAADQQKGLLQSGSRTLYEILQVFVWAVVLPAPG
jgi:hypothetical protein